MTPNSGPHRLNNTPNRRINFVHHPTGLDRPRSPHMSEFGSAASSSSSHQKVSPGGRSKAQAKQPTSMLARY